MGSDMDNLIVLVVLLVGWLIVAPIFGLIGFSQANKATREVAAARREIARLKAALGGDGHKTAQDEPDLLPDVQAEAAPQPPKQYFPGKTEATSDPVHSPVSPRPIPAAAPAFSKTPRKSIDWERMIAANWMVWAGGLALAIGGLFLVRIAIDAGYFGPAQRVIAAALFGGGLIAAAIRASGAPLVAEAENAVRFLPQILAGAGIVSLYGACIGAGLIYGFVPPLIALGLVVLVSLVAVGLSLRFGSMLAALGLSGAYVAPLLTGAESGSVVPLLPYFAVVTGAGLTMVRLQGWRFLSWLTLIGAGLWGLIAVGGRDELTPLAVPAYALALAVIGLIYGAHEARKPLLTLQQPGDAKRMLAGFGSSQFAAYLFFALAGGLILLTGLERSADIPVTGVLALFGGLGLYASWQHPGYGLMTPLAGLATLTCLLLWQIDAPPLIYACLAAGLSFGLGGTFVMSRPDVKAPVAATAALMPPAALFIAFWREGELVPHFSWGLAALLIAVVLGTVLDVMRRKDAGLKSHPGAAASYALGAVLSLALAPFLVLSGLWLGAAMAVTAGAVALILRRFDLPLLRFVGPLIAALATALLIRPGMLMGVEISTVPILNEMTFGFGIAILALIGGGWLARAHKPVRQAYEGATLILGFSLIGLTIRHIAGNGVLNGPFDGIGEASAYAIAYFGMATSFAWRFGGKGWFWRAAEYAAFAIGCVGILVAVSELGLAPLGDLPIANLLLPAFALPATLLVGYAAGLRRTGRNRGATMIGALAMLLGFVWVTLEVARGIGDPMLRDWYGSDAWAYSPAWIAYAFALLFWGVWKTRASARYASLGILILAIGKVFLIDMAALEGTARAVSFIGLGAALISVALFYQRYVFGSADDQPLATATSD